MKPKLITLGLFLLGILPAMAGTGLPLPRFVTLRTERVNLRVGPGEHYPLSLIYTTKGLPVQVIAEYDVWRKIRDAEGSEGWVHQCKLSGRRMVLIRSKNKKGHPPITLYKEPTLEAHPVATLKPGVIAQLEKCQDTWCYLTVKRPHVRVQGWIERAYLWGMELHENK